MIFGDEMAVQAAEVARDELEARIAKLEGLMARR
jgi:hypothetical protein